MAQAPQPPAHDDQALQQRLAEAEGNLQALLAGQVDAMLDAGSGSALLLRQAQEALRQSEARYRWLANELAEAQQIAHVGSWQWEVDQAQMTWSDELYRIYGLPPGSEPATFAGFVERVHPDDRDLVQSCLAGVVAYPRAFSVDFRVVRPDGSLRFLRCRGRGHLDPEGRVVRLVGTGHDVTDWVLAQEQIRALNSQLEARVRERTAQLEAANAALRAEIAERQQAQQEITRLNQDLNRRVTELQALLDLLPVGICVAHDPAGERVTCNAAARAMLGLRPDEAFVLSGARPPGYRVLRNGEEVPRRELPLQAALERGAETRAMEYEVVHSDGTRLSLLEYASPLRDEHGQVRGCLGVFVDITALKRAEVAKTLLADAGRVMAMPLGHIERLRSVAQLMVPLLADWCAVFLAEAGKPVQTAVAHGDPRQAALAEALASRYPGDWAPPSQLARVLQSGESLFAGQVTPEMLAGFAENDEHLRALQSFGLRSVLLIPLVPAAGHVLGVLTCVMAESGRQFDRSDLSVLEELARRMALALENDRLYAAERAAREQAERANAELEARVAQRTAQLQSANARLERSQEYLRRLSSHLQAAREDERTRIAREIHDELGQQLTALKMDAAWLHRQLEGAGHEAQPKVRAMASLIDHIVQAVRRISTDLRPGILDDLGLLAAIEWQLQEFEVHHGIKARLRTTLEHVALDSQAATALFRIVQEALTNVAQHANATTVTVTLREEEGWLVLRLHDNGRGISEAEVSHPKSFGLLGMRERVYLLGGEIRVDGRRGRGTVVTARVPLSAVRSAAGPVDPADPGGQAEADG